MHTHTQGARQVGGSGRVSCVEGFEFLYDQSVEDPEDSGALFDLQ